ncbi:MAG: arsenite methyltransferase [Euryarchaeota archaeon]|nr:arsenite methyltransferase [Euryarchaeota archaeon]MBU4139440.1 arsenite methyltransferase [Euryarchaeota archaeon]
MKPEEIKKVVREGYGRIAKTSGPCCPPTSSCCGSSRPDDVSKTIGYSDEELSSVPEGANLGLGCGNPVALASLKKGETVLDLGSGPGFDCFLAANKVGKEGKVIGVDMTPDMLDRARENAKKGNYTNVEFRLGEIENLPAADNSVDAIISNCVINLAPDKRQVFKEAHRVLRSGGRLMVSDLVLTKELPDALKGSVEGYLGCISGAILKEAYLRDIKEAGFREVRIVDESHYLELLSDPGVSEFIEKFNIPQDVLKEIAKSIVSIKVQGIK